MDLDEIRKKVEAARWYHSFELVPGVVTPGKYPTNAREILDQRYHLPEDLGGLSALDIGALDGPYSFELERRGAEVVSIDIQDPNRTGYNTAKEVLHSRARYIQGNVYELSRLVDKKFDIILFFGVWYHLKHPLLAFDQIAEVITPDGALLVSGECIRTYAQPESNNGSPSPLARQMADSDTPIALFYSGPYKDDPYSWFIPNRACVEEWLKASGFQLTEFNFWDQFPNQRMFGTAKPIPGHKKRVDNPVW